MAKLTPPDTDDIGELVDWALDAADITQYRLAQRMAEIRGTALASQDQALRRIRRLGQVPNADVAADMAAAFRPELDLADEFFFRPRTQAMQIREATLAALREIEGLRARVAALEKAQGSRAKNAPKRKGTS